VHLAVARGRVMQARARAGPPRRRPALIEKAGAFAGAAGAAAVLRQVEEARAQR
jgi:hypothetical protein